MKVRKTNWLLCGAALTFVLGVAGGALAKADGDKPAAKADGDKPAAKAKGDKPKGDKPKGDKPKGDKPKGAMLPKKLAEGIEAKLGKPMTEDQKTQVMAAATAQKDAIKAAHDKFLAEVSAATGISVADLEAMEKPAPRGDKPKGDKPNGDKPKGDKPKAPPPADNPPPAMDDKDEE